jgi:hypothetical protein
MIPICLYALKDIFQLMYNLSPFDQPYNIVAAICLYIVLEKEAKSSSLEKLLN